MDRQTTFLLALGLLIAAGLVVSLSGWILFARDRRARRAELAGADAHHPEVSEER
jgi:hypothetical protein